MKYISIKTSLISIAVLLTGLSSCISTNMIEPSASENSDDEIVLNLVAPSDAKTRADEGYTLRYVAKLFTITTGTSYNTESMQRAVILGNSDSDNKIVFHVEDNKHYRIFVFADYIPTPSSEVTTYNDHFYDTGGKNEQIEMKISPGSEEKKLSNKFFNNDFYDCFSYTDTVHKSILKKELNCVLKRAVAKVQFIDNSMGQGNLQDIKFSNLVIGNLFNQQTQQIIDSKIDLKDQSFKAEDILKISDNNVRFFYYTFAKPLNSKEEPQTKLTAKFNITDINSNSLSIASESIPVAQNYITTVKTKLIPQPQEDNQENQDSPSTDVVVGDEIILGMATVSDWSGSLDFTLEKQ